MTAGPNIVVEDGRPIENGWIELIGGTRFPIDLVPSKMARLIAPEEVAWALCRLCRYNGHTTRTYVVGEHTIVMADYVEANGGSPQDCLTALHHDDAEYIIGDLAGPLKVRVPQFKTLETRIDTAVAIRFETTYPFPAWLKELDARIIVDERAAICRPSKNRWACDDLQPLGVKFLPFYKRWHWWLRNEWLERHERWSRERSKLPFPQRTSSTFG